MRSHPASPDHRHNGRGFGQPGRPVSSPALCSREHRSNAMFAGAVTADLNVLCITAAWGERPQLPRCGASGRQSVDLSASRGRTCPAIRALRTALVATPAEVLAEVGLEVPVLCKLRGGAMAEQAGSLRRHRGSRYRVNPGPKARRLGLRAL